LKEILAEIVESNVESTDRGSDTLTTAVATIADTPAGSSALDGKVAASVPSSLDDTDRKRAAAQLAYCAARGLRYNCEPMNAATARLVSLLPDRFIDDGAIIVPDSIDRAVNMDMYYIDHVRSSRAMPLSMITIPLSLVFRVFVLFFNKLQIPHVVVQAQKFILKHYSRARDFHADLDMLNTLERAAPNCPALPRAIKIDADRRMMLISPLLGRNWTDVDVSTPLTWKVLQAACTVLQLMHANGFVHGDISPQNITLDAAEEMVVIMNENTCSLSIGTELEGFWGSIDYASDAIGVLLQGHLSVPYTYLPLDDHKSLFLTVLSRYLVLPPSAQCADRRYRMPWSIETVECQLASTKWHYLAHAERLIFTAKLRADVGDAMFAFLRRWFELAFRDESALESCARIVAHLQTFPVAMGAAAAADDGACRLRTRLHRSLALHCVKSHYQVFSVRNASLL
jgi:hypothetical protein